jgi:hypothetical protein
MIIRVFTLVLEPDNPVRFSLAGFREYLADKLNEYVTQQRNNSAGFIHRYPAVQCKMIKNTLTVVGISQGAEFLKQETDYEEKISRGENSCTVVGRDAAVRTEEFGISPTTTDYEFLTPWLGLNQQNTKKFYELKGKQERDAFIGKILADGLATLAKSLDCKTPAPVTCRHTLRFRKDWIDNTSVMVFTGRFRTNLWIPDYLGIGRSVTLGFGTIHSITASSNQK